MPSLRCPARGSVHSYAQSAGPDAQVRAAHIVLQPPATEKNPVSPAQTPGSRQYAPHPNFQTDVPLLKLRLHELPLNFRTNVPLLNLRLHELPLNFRTNVPLLNLRLHVPSPDFPQLQPRSLPAAVLPTAVLPAAVLPAAVLRSDSPWKLQSPVPEQVPSPVRSPDKKMLQIPMRQSASVRAIPSAQLLLKLPSSWDAPLFSSPMPGLPFPFVLPCLPLYGLRACVPALQVQNAPSRRRPHAVLWLLPAPSGPSHPLRGQAPAASRRCLPSSRVPEGSVRGLPQFP